MEPFNKYGILIQDCMIYPIFNKGGLLHRSTYARICRALVLALVAPLISVLPALVSPSLLPQAHAATSNGSMVISSGGQEQVSTGANTYDPTAGVTFEAYVNFSSIAASNQIFRSWTFNSNFRVIDLIWSSTGVFTWHNDQLSGSSCSFNSTAPLTGTWYNLEVVPGACQWCCRVE